jgi:AraC-like DNA-binding protein
MIFEPLPITHYPLPITSYQLPVNSNRNKINLKTQTHMPVFMDRHDVAGNITAEHVAHIHQEDLKVQGQFGCRGLTYWFDEVRKTAFCLIEAPNAEAIEKMHNLAHGDTPNQVIEVDMAIVESFLGRIQDPQKTEDTELNIIRDPAFRTIMVVSLKQLSLLPRNDNAFTTSLNNFYTAVLQLLTNYDGKLVNQTENKFLISFKTVSKAVGAAFDIQSLFRNFERSVHNDLAVLKIALSAGVPVTKKPMLFEDTIKLAERICKIARAELIITSEVRELYNSENSAALQENEGTLFLNAADEKFLTQLMDYAEMHWGDIHLKVDDFSKPLGCSKSQLYRRLTALTGKSPNSFIREYRLNEALILLNKNTGNVSEIAFETGFSSPSYFSKVFQKTYGYSPSEYQRM